MNSNKPCVSSCEIKAETLTDVLRHTAEILKGMDETVRVIQTRLRGPFIEPEKVCNANVDGIIELAKHNLEEADSILFTLNRLVENL